MIYIPVYTGKTWIVREEDEKQLFKMTEKKVARHSFKPEYPGFSGYVYDIDCCFTTIDAAHAYINKFPVPENFYYKNFKWLYEVKEN